LPEQAYVLWVLEHKDWNERPRGGALGGAPDTLITRLTIRSIMDVGLSERDIRRTTEICGS